MTSTTDDDRLAHLVDSRFRETVPEVSVVMPCLNEAETLATCIQEAMAAFQASGIAGEVVIADNDSLDGSQAIAVTFGARVVAVEKKGYGNALMGGIAAASGEYIVMGDSDASYNFGHVPRFVEKLSEGYDLVMGNRFLGGIEPGAMPWHHYWVGNPVLSGIGRLFFGCPVRDFHCGLRGFRRDAIERLQLSTTGMEFASEMVIKATLHGLRITEIPTTLRPDGRSRRPHLRSFRDGWRHLKLMLLLSPRWLFLVPGMTLLISGVTAVSLIGFSGGLPLGGTLLGVNTSIAAAMTAIVGFQVLLNGVFARRLAMATGLYPQRATRHFAERHASLERGIVLGLLCMLAGGFWLASALLVWKNSGSVIPAPSLTVSHVIPSLLLCLMGTQTVFGSFLMSLIQWAPKQGERNLPELKSHTDSVTEVI